MGPVTIGFGALLILVGLGGYLAAESQSPTALIPAGFGLILAMLGAVALKDSLRKHAMHAAAALGLLGCLLPGIMVVRRLLQPADPTKSQLGLISQAVMALTCAIFVGLCVRSFIAARRARAKGEQVGGA